MTAQSELRQKVYTKLANNKYSVLATITRDTYGTYDSDTGEASVASSTLSGYVLNIRIADAKTIPVYTELKENQKLYLFAGNGSIPLREDKISISGKTGRIELANDIAVGAAALFEIIVSVS